MKPENAARFVTGTALAGLAVALQERDALTHDHCDRVAGLAQELGMACGLSGSELRLLRHAAGLHDIGKIGIPDQVLKKPGTFDAHDRAVMQTHAVRGERILRAFDFEHSDVIASIVRHHHERFDGDGYPDGLAGEAIPALARIIAVIDAYDAMAGFRPHAPRRTHRSIMGELLDGAVGQHDPYLLKRFAELIGRSRYRAED